MAVFLALMVSPILIFPVELLFALKVFAVLGYRKVEQTAILHNYNRRLIYETIKTNPGLTLTALSHLTAIKFGPLKYHLSVLKLKRKILTFGRGRSHRYFENCGKYSEFEKLLIKHLTEETTNKILELLWRASPVSQQEIAGELGISAPSVFWHMKILESEKIVALQKSGRSVLYELTENAVMILQKYYSNK
jgi:predicted transcriptional regulator